mgnify:CR=1 FL=1
MIMKLNVSNELKSRLMHAAENGSVIAKDILLEVKKNVPVEGDTYGVPITASPPSASGRKRARSRKSGSCSRPAARIWPIPVSRTGTTRRHPGSRRIVQFWNPPRLLNCSRTCPSTHPTKSIISVAPSHWTAKSRSGCMKA